jgi:hypothetical protein
MTNVETMGVDCGGGASGKQSGVIRAADRAVFRTPSARAVGTLFESGA